MEKKAAELLELYDRLLKAETETEKEEKDRNIFRIFKENITSSIELIIKWK